MTSIDEASGSFGSNAEQARELAAGITASKDLLDSLIGSLSALGLEAKTVQAQSTSDSAEQVTAQVIGIAETLESLRAQVEALKGLLTAAGAGSAEPPPQIASGKGGSKFTRPSHPPGSDRKPSSPPTVVDPRSPALTQANIRSENEVATTLARSGYEIEQNPPTKPNGKNPDYRIEGHHWDCYTVRVDNVEQVRTRIKRKVNPKDGKVQAHRIVLNLDSGATGKSTSITRGEIEQLLQRKPVTGLKEVKVIKDGQVHDLNLEG